jgi:protochlorophyllide reductase
VGSSVVEPEFAASGTYWSWGNHQKEGRKPFAQSLSAKATDHELGVRVWDDSSDMVEMPK